MADSEIKTIGQGLQKTALFNLPEQTGTCDEHGEFKSYQYPNGDWSACYQCTRRIENAERKREFEERQRASEAAAHKRLVSDATIPPRFASKTLDNFVAHSDGAKRALNIARAYVNDFDEGLKEGASLIFCGGVGTGKTHLAVGIANFLLDLKRRVRFVSVMNAVREVKETYRRDSEFSEREVIDHFIYPDLLILDEVGVQFGSDTEKMILFEIINGRYEQVKPTVVISNLAKEALGEFIGERSIDRLRENGGRLVVFDWSSHRRNAA